MDLAFFGLREPPFNPTPDPRFLHLTPGHQEALAQLLYGVQQRKGFILPTGEVGAGKPCALEQSRSRLLSTFETTSEKILRILLVGQSELRARLDLPELHQLKQRIGLRCSIPALAPTKARQYIRTRLKVASTAAAGLAALGVGHPDVIWFSLFGLARSARALLSL